MRRSTGPWTAAAHVVLRHLEANGCRLAPRVLGFDDRGREILTFLPGETIHPHPLDLLERGETLLRAGAFVAELHGAPPRHPDGTVSLHGELGPWNVLVDDGDWFAIDWDSTERGEPLREVAYSLFTFCEQRANEGIAGFVRLVAEGHTTMRRANAAPLPPGSTRSVRRAAVGERRDLRPRPIRRTGSQCAE